MAAARGLCLTALQPGGGGDHKWCPPGVYVGLMLLCNDTDSGIECTLSGLLMAPSGVVQKQKR